jgi:hypothetical protein
MQGVYVGQLPSKGRKAVTIAETPKPVKRKFWYYYTHYFCPPCGGETIYRERVYNLPKPEAYEDRHAHFQHMCYSCQYSMFM